MGERVNELKSFRTKASDHEQFDLKFSKRMVLYCQLTL